MLCNRSRSDRCHIGDESPNLSGIGLRCVSCNRPLVSAPYCIADCTHELYTCLFRQMARLLVNISRCLAYPNIDPFNINKNPRQLLFALLESSLLEPSKRMTHLDETSHMSADFVFRYGRNAWEVSYYRLLFYCIYNF